MRPFTRKRSLSSLPRTEKPQLEELVDYPGMTRWFQPTLLAKLLLRVVVADIFGQYADRRLLEAALDTDPKWKLQTRDDISHELPRDGDGAVWIDFVADLGDGFDATYAIAYLLAQESLTIDGQQLPRGGALFMGGDEVYPTASRDQYNAKLRAPYEFAFPDQKTDYHPRIYAIPGNHDWYDGLVNFLSLFARTKPTRIGNWRTHQKRSYFAVRISENCWVWAIDIALVADMDQPQADYFVAIAESMPQNANVILCTAEPGWYRVDSDSYRSLSYAAWIAENAGRSLRIPVILSGDTHHYSRYESLSGTQYITSGGGGAFLHGTHDLPEVIRAEWLRDHDEKLTLKHRESSAETSRQLLWGDLRFPCSHPGFSALLGTIYALFGYFLSLFPRCDLAVIFFLILTAGFLAYAVYQHPLTLKVTLRVTLKVTFKVTATTLLHSVAHFLAMIFLTFVVVLIASSLWDVIDWSWWAWALVFFPVMIALSAPVAGFIFGVYLLLTCMFLDMNHNDAFSAMRLDSYRHFLRIRVLGDQITVYPIGFDRTPKRSEWRDNPQSATDPTASYFVPPEWFSPRFLEPPIVIRASGKDSTGEIKSPSEMSRDEKGPDSVV